MTQHASDPHPHEPHPAESVPGRVDTALLTDLGPTLPGEGRPTALVPLLGRSPLQRHLAHLAALDFVRCVVVVDEQHGLGRPCALQAGELDLGEMEVEVVPGRLPSLDVPVLHVCAHGVYDRRLYRAVLDRGAPAEAVAGAGGEAHPVGLAVVGGAGETAPAPVTTVRVSEIDPYVPELRRRLTPYAHLIRSEEERARAADALLDATQKGVLDFPARYVHPPIENAFTRRLAPTRVTPNQITVLTGFLGFAVCALFAVERYGAALSIAFLVNVLDGVDGKLARIKLLASRFGDRLDHFLDVSFEFAWYLGIGWGLSGGNTGGPAFRAAVALILVMISSRAMSGVYKLIAGRQIHDHRSFDRAFRLVAGRRNIYVFVLIGGALTGNLRESFFACLAWGVVTVLTYTARTVIEAARGSWPRRAPRTRGS